MCRINRLFHHEQSKRPWQLKTLADLSRNRKAMESGKDKQRQAGHMRRRVPYENVYQVKRQFKVDWNAAMTQTSAFIGS